MLGRDPQMAGNLGIRQQTLVAKVERRFELRIRLKMFGHEKHPETNPNSTLAGDLQKLEGAKVRHEPADALGRVEQYEGLHAERIAKQPDPKAIKDRVTLAEVAERGWYSFEANAGMPSSITTGYPSNRDGMLGSMDSAQMYFRSASFSLRMVPAV